MRRLLVILPLLLFVGLAAVAAIPLLEGRDPHALPSVLIDRPAPPLDAPALPGRTDGVSLAALPAGVKLVNFFASWCIPCLAEHPVLTRLGTELPVYGIAYKDKAEDSLGWLARNGDPFAAVGADADGRIAIDWGVYGVPETFVLDAAGRIRYRHAGPLTPELVERELRPLLATLAAGP